MWYKIYVWCNEHIFWLFKSRSWFWEKGIREDEDGEIW